MLGEDGDLTEQPARRQAVDRDATAEAAREDIVEFVELAGRHIHALGDTALHRRDDDLFGFAADDKGRAERQRA